MIQKLSWFLYPFMGLYGLVVWVRNRLFDWEILKSTEFDIPVISIGNITVGGTGKTPHVEHLISLFAPAYNLAVLSRGYKRKTRGFVLANEYSTAEDIGDEPLQMKQKFPLVPFAVDNNRVNGIRSLCQAIPDLSLILLDDAYQHRWVKPGLSLLLIDYHRLIVDDQLLPVGRLREPAGEQRRANIIIISKCPGELKPIERRILLQKISALPHQTVFFSYLEYGAPCPVFPKKPAAHIPGNIFESSPAVLLVSGIASPRLLQDYISGFTEKIEVLRFPDHHFYRTRDLIQIVKSFDAISGKNKIIITTEKDAVRLRTFTEIEEDIQQRWYYIPVVVKISEPDEKLFKEKLLSHVENYSRSHSISHQIRKKVT